jgi:hypothetical protein
VHGKIVIFFRAETKISGVKDFGGEKGEGLWNFENDNLGKRMNTTAGRIKES